MSRKVSISVDYSGFVFTVIGEYDEGCKQFNDNPPEAPSWLDYKIQLNDKDCQHLLSEETIFNVTEKALRTLIGV